MTEPNAPNYALAQPELRRMVADMFSAASEERWAAGWYPGITAELRREGGFWTLLAFLAGGWPRWVDRPPSEAPGPWADELAWDPLSESELRLAQEYLWQRLPRPPRRSHDSRPDPGEWRDGPIG